MVDPSTLWTSPKFPFQDDPTDGNDDPSAHFSSFPDLLEHQSSAKSRTQSPSSSRLDGISRRSVSPLRADHDFSGSPGPGSRSSNNDVIGEFVHGFPGMPYGHGARRDSSSTSTTISRMGMNTRPYSPTSTGGDNGGRSTQRNSFESKGGIISTPRFSRPNSPPIMPLMRQYSSNQTPYPGLRTPYSDPSIPVPSASPSTFSATHHPHFTHNPHIGPSSMHHTHTHHRNHQNNFTSPHSSIRHSGETSPTDDLVGGSMADQRGDDIVQPEVLDLVNVNEGVSEDEDDGYAAASFGNGALKDEPPTPRIGHLNHNKNPHAAYQEAQRLLNQVTKSLNGMSKSSALGNVHSHSPSSLMADLRRKSGDTPDELRMPLSPLEDESGRAGNSNFLVDMAKMSTSMNGQPVQVPGHMHSIDPGQIDGTAAMHDMHMLNMHHTAVDLGSFGILGEEDDDDQDEEPLYVNAKQYHRILKRRAARARLEEMNRVVKERKVSAHGVTSCAIAVAERIPNRPLAISSRISTQARLLTTTRARWSFLDGPRNCRPQGERGSRGKRRRSIGSWSWRRVCQWDQPI